MVDMVRAIDIIPLLWTPFLCCNLVYRHLPFVVNIQRAGQEGNVWGKIRYSQ